VHKLNKLVKGKPSPESFKFKNLGTMAYLGSMFVVTYLLFYKSSNPMYTTRTAIFDRSQASVGPKQTGTGFLAWLIWRSAYLTMTVSPRNKCVSSVYTVRLLNRCNAQDSHTYLLVR
jgi:NADH dehydrogenase FAD-containing subunit